MRIALGIEYDGSRFVGWQTQPGGGAVQDAVETALGNIAGCEVKVTCAGRTDSGVHALGQVVHFDTSVERPDSAWVRGANAMLPDSVAILWAHRVAEDFHARYSATARRYRYLLADRAVRPALGAGRLGWFHQRLQVDAMREAARLVVGEHDFSAFRASECQAKSPVRTIESFEVERRGERVEFTVCANAFLHHMVRNLVGCLVYVGAGRQPAAWMGEVLASRDRRLAAPTFSAHGLYLEHVRYDARWGLPASAKADAGQLVVA